MAAREGRCPISRQYWFEELTWSTVDGTAIANSAAEAILFPDTTIPANYMQDGRQLIYEAWGRWGATATPTLTIRLRWGGVAGTILAQTPAVTLAAMTTAIWVFRLRGTTRSNGATGSVFFMGSFDIYSTTAPTIGSATGAPASAPIASAGASAPAAVTVNLTADTALSLTAQWSAANASNTIQGHNNYISSPN